MRTKIHNSLFKSLHNILIEDENFQYDGGDIIEYSRNIMGNLLYEFYQLDDLCEQPVLMLFPNGFEYVASLWGIWRAGGMAVPLSPSHTVAEIQYILENTGAKCIIYDKSYQNIVNSLKKQNLYKMPFVEKFYKSNCMFFLNPILKSRETLVLLPNYSLPKSFSARKALMIYTSGTTSKPKGVVHTHKSIENQIKTLIDAWHWQSNDYILNVLPLHHIHGIVNITLCALWCGAKTYMLPKFDAAKVWQLFMNKGFTVFMAVPTIYYKLIEEYDKADKMTQKKMSEACHNMRLMVSGSAALPITVLERWKEISGHFLLERYGMSETGMLLSNPYQGERKAGMVGLPLPSVKVKVVDEQGKEVKEGKEGELWVQTKGLFSEYWNNPEATAKAFKGKWFKTGDMVRKDEQGYYKILGRNSTDILKSGGYKISALEIEETLREHPQIADCAVVGLEDEQWGQKIAAAIVLKPHQSLSKEDLEKWLRERLAKYKIPSKILFINELSKNALGKTVKGEVVKLF
ncbi:MAG: acyl-CoA synthetase [Flammeovirgaceae bacterium]